MPAQGPAPSTWRTPSSRRTSPATPCCTCKSRPATPGWRRCWRPWACTRLVVHQATGMIAAQLGATPSDALARLRAAAFERGSSIYDIAQDVVERRVRFGE